MAFRRHTGTPQIGSHTPDVNHNKALPGLVGSLETNKKGEGEFISLQQIVIAMAAGLSGVIKCVIFAILIPIVSGEWDM